MQRPSGRSLPSLMRDSEEAREAEKECEESSHRQGQIMEAWQGVGL